MGHSTKIIAAFPPLILSYFPKLKKRSFVSAYFSLDFRIHSKYPKNIETRFNVLPIEEVWAMHIV